MTATDWADALRDAAATLAFLSGLDCPHQPASPEPCPLCGLANALADAADNLSLIAREQAP